ncbi:MAG: transcriptional regulator with XRE-family HTH domain [Verrucomicrobiales bacterium]|jgi:transcriptional regulator with XRE-family HTH domain
MTFGELIKDLRIMKRLTLRQFCQQLGLDPSNWSKIERGLNPPPKDADTIERWGDFFELTGDDRHEFLDAAAVARMELPRDMIENKQLLTKLPAFFRVLRANAQDEQRIEELAAECTKAHEFTLVLGNDPSDSDADQLYGVIQDATLATSCGVAELTFCREASSLEDAVKTAVSEVQRAGFSVKKVELLLEPLLATA